MLVSELIATARFKLFDPAPGAGWSDAELVSYFSEAQRAVCFLKPDAYPVRGAVTLAAGLVQTLPAGGIALIDITHNTTGRERVVTITDAALLHEANRFWPASTQQAEVENFATDPRDPRRYLVFPPNDGTGSVFLIYGAVPAALTSAGDTITLPDSYGPALVSHALAQAFAKPSARQDGAAAQMHQQAFMSALGIKSQAQVAVSPRVSASPGL